MKRSLIIACVIALPVSIASLAGIPHALGLGILVTAAILWMTEIIPAGATGLLVPVLITVLGVAPAAAAFSTFSNHILFLILGSLLLVRAMQETGVDLFLAEWVLRLTGRLPAHGVAIVLVLLTWFTGMWMSNTACALLFLPIVLGVLRSQEGHLPPEAMERLQYHLLFSVALIPSIGGMLTPIGSLPNAVALGFLEQSGASPSFLEWLIAVAPLSLALLIAVHLILSFRYPLSEIALKGPGGATLSVSPNKLSSDGIRVIWIALLAVVLWVAPGALASYDPAFKWISLRLPLGVASLCIALLLFIVPRASTRGDESHESHESHESTAILSPSALSSIDYNILALFGGGLALGEMLEETGLAAWMGSYLSVAGSVVPGGMPFTLVVATIFLSEIGSNTASVSIMVPIALGTSSELATQPTVMGVALASGLGAMLPVSTPPNAIVYSTGRIKIGHMIRTGILVDLVGCFLVYLWLVGR